MVDVHIKSGNTPTLRLEQDGSSGFTPQTWDVAGNEANFFIRDATNGSTLPFRIFPGAPSNAINIEASTGDVGFGTTSPEDDLEISTSEITADLRLTSIAGSGSEWRLRANSMSDQFVIQDGIGRNSAFKIDAGAGNNTLVLSTNGVVPGNTNTGGNPGSPL